MDARLQSVHAGSQRSVTTRRCVLPGSRRSWWPKHVRKNCEPQKLKTWRGPSSSARDEGVRLEPVDAEQRDVPDSDPRKPDSDATKRVRISTKRSDPGELTEGAHKKLRTGTKQSRPLWTTTKTASEQLEKRVSLPETHAAVDPEAFALMLESGGNLETYTELNAVALDLHEPDPETMWSSDLGWFQSQHCRRLARRRSRSCKNSTHSKRFRKMRLRDTTSSVHGSWTNLKRLEN